MKKKIISFLLSLLVLLSSLPMMISVSADTEVGTTYYVDSVDGNNDNDGLSESTPWKTLSKISAKTFSAGDKVLLKKGSVFDGQSVNLQGNGTVENPVTLGSYGDGDSLPLINAGGQLYGVQIKGQSNIIVENLEITNISTVGDRFYNGIYVTATGTYNSYSNIIIRNNVIHDITCAKSSHTEGSSTVYTEEGAGIFFRGAGHTTDFSDVLIENNTITEVRGNGIFLHAGYNRTNSKTAGFGEGNIIRNNYLENIGHDGILVNSNNGTLVEYNVVNCSHNVSTAAEVAIWPFASDNCVFQFNEAYNTQTASDGQGFDCDYQCVGTVFQYNYGHDNVGGFMLVCTEDRFRPNGGTGEDAYNKDSIIRYNISQNNAARQFQLLGHIENTKIYNNTIATRWGLSAVAVDTYKKNATYTSSDFEGTRPDFPINTQFVNNLFYDFSNYPTGSFVSKYSFESGSASNITGYATDTVWDNNLVYGRYNYQAPKATKTAEDGTVIIKSAENNLTSDPMLVDPFSATLGLETCEGYKLLEGSPAIGAGKIIEDNGGRDFFGNSVSNTEAPNIGAYQGDGVKDTSTKLYYDDVYETLLDWEDNKVGASGNTISFVSYVGNGTLKVVDDPKMLSSIGSTKGLSLYADAKRPYFDIQFYSTKIKESNGMRMYAYGNGTAYSIQVILNDSIIYYTSISAVGGWINIKPGISVTKDNVKTTLSEEDYKAISKLEIKLNVDAQYSTFYFDDIQLDMTGNVETENAVFIPVDTTPGAEISSLVPKDEETEDKTGEKYTVTVDNVDYEVTYYDLFTLPKNDTNSFIGYSDGEIFYTSGYTVRVTEDMQFTSINLNAVMVKGASMRLNNGTGLRFYMDTDLELIESLIDKGVGIEMGTLIAPEDLLGGDELTHNLDNSTTTKFLDVKYTARNKYFVENGKNYIVGSILNIKEANINRFFVGRGYVTVKIGTNSKTVYADYYDNDFKNNSRSIAYVAYMFKNSMQYGYLSTEQQGIVDYYASKYQPADDPSLDDFFD